MTIFRLIAVSFTTLVLSFTPSAYAISEYDLIQPAPLNFSLGTGFEFFSGDYGTDQTIDIWQIPLLVEWSPHQRLGLSVEIPFMHQSSTDKTVMSGPGSTGSTRSESGLGDIALNATFTLFNKDKQSPRLVALLYAKLPTGDEQKGLGTGEFDWGGGVGFGQRFGDWSTYTEALYLLPGSSELYPLDNYWEWLASVSYRINSSLRPGISLSGGTPAFARDDGPLEIKARLSGLSGEKTSYSLYISRGLSDTSPDWGIGIFGYLDF